MTRPKRNLADYDRPFLHGWINEKAFSFFTENLRRNRLYRVIPVFGLCLGDSSSLILLSIEHRSERHGDTL